MVGEIEYLRAHDGVLLLLLRTATIAAKQESGRPYRVRSTGQRSAYPKVAPYGPPKNSRHKKSSSSESLCSLTKTGCETRLQILL